MLLCSNHNGWLAIKFGGLLLPKHESFHSHMCFPGVAASCIIGLRQSGAIHSNQPNQVTTHAAFHPSTFSGTFTGLPSGVAKPQPATAEEKPPLRAKKRRGYKATQLMVSPLPSHVLVVGALIGRWSLPVLSCRTSTIWGTKKKKRWIRAHEILIGSFGFTEWATRMLVRKMNSRKPPLSPIA